MVVPVRHGVLIPGVLGERQIQRSVLEQLDPLTFRRHRRGHAREIGETRDLQAGSLDGRELLNTKCDVVDHRALSAAR